MSPNTRALNRHMPKIGSRIVGSVAIIIAIVPATFYFIVKYNSLMAGLDAQAAFKGEIISQFISTNPAMWRFQDHRLEEFIASWTVPAGELSAIVDLDERIIVEAGEPPLSPVWTVRVRLYNAGSPVGYLLIWRSSVPLITETAAVGFVGLLLGFAICFSFRSITSRALNRAHSALARSSRMLTMLSRFDQSLMPGGNEAMLVDNACRAVVDSGGYRAVLVGLLDSGAPRALGFKAGYSQSDEDVAYWQSEMFSDKDEIDFILSALRSGEPKVASGMLATSDVAPRALFDAQLSQTFLLALPLLVASRPVGAMIVEVEGDVHELYGVELHYLKSLSTGLANGIMWLRNESERRGYEEKSLLHERAIEATRNGIMITAVEGGAYPVVYVNPAFERITGYFAADALGRDGLVLLGIDAQQIEYERIQGVLRQGREHRMVLRCLRNAGPMYWIDLSLCPVRNSQGDLTHYIAVVSDDSDRVYRERGIIRQANYDALTGLANLNLFNDRVKQAMRLGERSGKTVALMVIDLDGFRALNETLGHTIGDELLKVVAERLRGSVRESDTVARFGGDEFMVLLSEVASYDVTVQVAEKILARLAVPVQVAKKELTLTASIGISFYPKDARSCEQLLKCAEAAMCSVKGEKRNGLRCFSAEMRTSSDIRRELERDLYRAIERDQLLLYFQPRVNIESGAVSAAEALLRWQHPRYGRIPPLDIISIAEETDQIHGIGRWVLQTACNECKKWQDAGYPNVGVSVNVSSHQIHDEYFADVVNKAIKQAGIPPECLELEFTENILMGNPESTIASLTKLKKVGVRLTIDDFGTEYFKLRHLKKLPIESLKIDDKITEGIFSSDSENSVLASAIIALAHSLDLTVVAEKIETADQLDYLAAKNCDEIQGFHVCAPVPADNFMEVLRDGSGFLAGKGFSVKNSQAMKGGGLRRGDG